MLEFQIEKASFRISAVDKNVIVEYVWLEPNQYMNMKNLSIATDREPGGCWASNSFVKSDKFVIRTVLESVGRLNIFS